MSRQGFGDEAWHALAARAPVGNEVAMRRLLARRRRRRKNIRAGAGATAFILVLLVAVVYSLGDQRPAAAEELAAAAALTAELPAISVEFERVTRTQAGEVRSQGSGVVIPSQRSGRLEVSSDTLPGTHELLIVDGKSYVQTSAIAGHDLPAGATWVALDGGRMRSDAADPVGELSALEAADLIEVETTGQEVVEGTVMTRYTYVREGRLYELRGTAFVDDTGLLRRLETHTTGTRQGEGAEVETLLTLSAAEAIPIPTRPPDGETVTLDDLMRP